MRRILLLSAATFLVTGPVLAGSLEAPPPAPPVVPAPAPAPSTPDWTGFYLGSQIGYVSVDTNVPGVSGDDLIAGFTAGYDYDMGNVVVGGSVDYDWTNATLVPGLDVENVWRAKLRGGYKLGRGLVYATAGYANADTSTLGDEDGYFAGAGYDYMVGDHLAVGGELLFHEFDTFNGTPVNVDATTFAIRTTYKF